MHNGWAGVRVVLALEVEQRDPTKIKTLKEYDTEMVVKIENVQLGTAIWDSAEGPPAKI